MRMQESREMPDTNGLVMLWADKVDMADVIVFDLDGTLIETDAANLLAYKEAIAHCLGEGFEEKLPSTKRLTREVLRECLVAVPETMIQSIVRYKEEVYGQFLHATTINPIMLRLLELAQGKEVILASNCRRSRAELVLAHHGMNKKFTRKYFSESNNASHKYQRIFWDLGVDPRRVVVFDDDPVSAAAALAVGIRSNSVFLVPKSW